MKIRSKYAFLSILAACFLLEAFSLTEQTPAMQKAPANVKVDGKITEWGDTLALYDSKTKLSYTIAYNDTDLYITTFTSDRMLRHKIMAAGITISINSEGKKKKTFSMTYPLPDKSAVMTRGNEESDDIPRPSLLESTSIKVSGFKDVESDVITTSNTYGFQAAFGFDDKHNLAYETAIPLKMLNIKANKKKLTELAINIAINGIERPSGQNGERRGGGSGMDGGGIGGGGGMGGSGGGMSGGGGRRGGGGGGGRGGSRGGGGGSQQQDRSGMSETTDFWINLAIPEH